MTMEKQPFEDVSPMKNSDFPASHVSLLEGKRLSKDQRNTTEHLRILLKTALKLNIDASQRKTHLKGVYLFHTMSFSIHFNFPDLSTTQKAQC